MPTITSIKTPPLTEQFVQEAAVEYLASLGYTKNLSAKELHEHGVDIKVAHGKYSRYWLVECKGGKYNEVGFIYSLGQILTRMHRHGKPGYKYGYKYGVAFPATNKQKALKRLPYDVAHKLNLYVFLVHTNGEVELIDWKALKLAQVG